MSGRAAKRRSGKAARARRAFSLAEVLLAIFILGLGMVAVAALFPAGIAQQQQSVDDVVGTVVANNALSVLRAKLRPDDFGTVEEHDSTYVSPTIPGDWMWRRPAHFRQDVSSPSFGFIPIGSISVFNDTLPGTTASDGVPWSTTKYDTTLLPNGPAIIVRQGERYYPMQSSLPAADRSRAPQYVWDCMFRRFGGRVLVAIFVYRASMAGVGEVQYFVPPPSGNVPRIPVQVDLRVPGPYPWSDAPWDADENLTTINVVEPSVLIPNTDVGDAYDPSDPWQSWQAPSQWLLDQNNNVFRVLGGRRSVQEGPVELATSIQPVNGLFPTNALTDRTGTPFYYFNARPRFTTPPIGPLPGRVYENVVTHLWFVPDADLRLPSNDIVHLTPVFVAVREL